MYNRKKDSSNIVSKIARIYRTMALLVLWHREMPYTFVARKHSITPPRWSTEIDHNSRTKEAVASAISRSRANENARIKMSLDTLDINLKRDKRVTITSDTEPIVNAVHGTRHWVYEEVFRWNFHSISGDWNLTGRYPRNSNAKAYYFYYLSFKRIFLKRIYLDMC